MGGEVGGGGEEALMEKGVTGLVSNRTRLRCSLWTALSSLSLFLTERRSLSGATQRCDLGRLTLRRIPSDFYHL